jgi:hypothetical protein
MGKTAARHWRRVLVILAVVAGLPLIAIAASAQTVQISAPSNGANVTGTVTFSCAASGSGVVLENLFVDRTWLAQSPAHPDAGGFTFSFPWDSASVADGAHTLVCRGYNSSGITIGFTKTAVDVVNETATPTPVSTPTPTATLTATATPTATRTATPTSTLLGSTPTSTATPDGATLTLGSTALIKSIPRIGMNLNFWTSWGAEQYASNVIMNPGFEPTVDRAIVIVNSSSSTGFEDNASWLGRPNGFWANGTYQVLTGESAGVSGTIENSVQADGAGLPSFTTSGSAPPLAVGDAISVSQVQTSGNPANWWISSGSTVRINTSDSRPESPGHSVAEMSLQTGTPSEIDSYLDDGYQFGGQNFLPVTGAWQLSFWARTTTTAGATLSATFRRNNGSSAFLSETVTLTNAWQQFTFPITASDNGPAGSLDLQFVANGSTGTLVHLDDVQLGNASDLANGAWRSQLITTLEQLNPGYLRDWQGQIGDTMENRLASTFGRGPTRYNPDPSNGTQWFLYSIPDFLDLCHQVGAQPWITIPTTLYSAEYTALGQYLAQAQQTYNFKEIVVEYGDENWNSVYRGAGIQNPVTMGQAANRGFTLLRAAAGSSVPLHLEVNSQYVNSWIGQQAILNAPEADGVDIAPYYFYTLNSTDSEATALTNLFAMSDEPTDIAALAAFATPANKSIDVYEVNTSNYDGSALEPQRDPYVVGMASGSALADRMITAMYAGVTRQMVFDLAQYNYTINSTVGNVMLWGVANSLADDVSLRPTGLAVQMLNAAISGDFYPVTVSGPGSSGVKAAAFLGTNGWSIAIVSASSTPSQVTINQPASGAAPTEAYTLSAATPLSTNDVTSNNPSGDQQVSIVQSSVSDNRVTVPAYGLVVLLPN